MERATIHQGTKYEISWTADEAITPDLVARIKESGDELHIDWLDSPFTTAVELLLETHEMTELRSRLYDEDPVLLDTISLIIQSPLIDDSKNARKMARLYLPVIIIILAELTADSS